MIEEAKQILGDESGHFISNLEKYEVNLGEPEFDMVCFIEYIRLKKNKELLDKWAKFWKKYGETKSFQNLTYSAVSYAQYFQNMRDITVTGKKISTEEVVTSFLEHLKKYGIKLDWETYLTYFFERKERIMPKFNKTQFRVFLKMLALQTSETSVVAPALGMDSSNYAKYKKDLYDRLLYTERYILNSTKLNLRTMGVILKGAKDFDVDTIQRSPYITRIYSSLMSDTYILNYMVPYGKQIRDKVKSDFQELVEKLESAYSPISIAVVSENIGILTLYNYNYYDFKRGYWTYSEKDILFGLKGHYPEGKDPSIIREITTDGDESFTLDMPGINLINYLITHRMTNVNRLVEIFDMSYSNLKSRIDKYEQLQIIKRKLSPSYLFGLESLMLFYSAKKDAVKRVTESFAFLPEAFIRKARINNEEKLITIIRVPKSSLTLILKLLKVIHKDILEDIIVVGGMYGKVWKLPGKTYDSLWGEWEYEKEKLLTI